MPHLIGDGMGIGCRSTADPQSEHKSKVFKDDEITNTATEGALPPVLKKKNCLSCDSVRDPITQEILLLIQK